MKTLVTPLMNMSPFANPPRGHYPSSGKGGESQIDANTEKLRATLNASHLLASTLSQQDALPNDSATARMVATLSNRHSDNDDGSGRSAKRMRLDGLRIPMGHESLLPAPVSSQQGHPSSLGPLSEQSLLRAEQLLQEQAAGLSSIYGHSRLGLLVGSPLQSGLSTIGALQQLALGNQRDQLATLLSLADLEALRSAANQQSALQSAANIYALQMAPTNSNNFTALLQHVVASNQMSVTNQLSNILRASTNASTALSSPTANLPSDFPRSAADLPECEEGRVEPFFKRPMFPLAIDEDPNWLSEFHCFVRSDLVDVFRASHHDVKSRSNSITYQQVGLRCRFCAHLSPCARAGRGSAFPSSLRQIYQSFTMMLRDHFGSCEAMPSPIQEKFLFLKDQPAQGATDSKRFWIYSAMKIGLADSPEGIVINELTRAAGVAAPPFGTVPGQPWPDDAYRSILLLLPSDRHLVSEFLFLIMSQVQVIRLTEAERIGNRRSLQLGLPGFGCRYCCEHRRLGLCRLFPARRRTLPSKIHDIFDHLRRCNLCPEPIKDHLMKTQHQLGSGFHSDEGGNREFFDLVWSRLGHGTNNKS